MEIALNTIFLFLFLIYPGIVYRRFYFQGPFYKQFKTASWLRVITESILPGVIIQFLTILTVKSFASNFPFPDLSAVYGAINQNNLPSELYDLEVLTYGIVYLLMLLLYASILGVLSFQIIRVLGLDKKFAILRFQNNWHYYFKGEILRFKDFNDIKKNQRVLTTKADILVRIGENKTRLYKGLIRQYTTSADNNNLEQVFITDANRYREKMNPSIGEHGGTKELVGIPGDIMVINASDILNINLNYITTQKEPNKWIVSFLSLFSVISLIVFMTDVFDFYRNLGLFMAIMTRIIMITVWILIFTLINVVADKKLSQGRGSEIALLSFLIVAFLLALWLISIDKNA